ncbi:Hypothetical protein PHPALM_6664 [Phytophthora palmivora]|uniref:Uncharacterized protein n=1 Tax=Phytophthora palmivora TaxID=4796 RepID=A0A2P4YEB4_9STRA|nr:Hypothetical protein PHPALM_6664 [Phytophthora palmivora]
MAAGADFEVEGVTTFASHPNRSFRYLVSLKSEKVNIWLEDRSSKKQCKAEYVTTTNTFVDASPAVYVSCFQQSLDCSVESTEESQRKLISLEGGKLQLEMSIKLRLLRSVRDVSYVFVLKPVTVEQVDVLESKLKDQQEELERLRGRIDQIDRIFLYARSSAWAESKLMWESLDSDKFTLTTDNTSITFLIAGVYAIGVLVNHVPNTSGSISLQKNGVEIQRAATASARYYDFSSGNQNITHETSSTLMCIVQVNKNEELAVVFTGISTISNVSSYLSVLLKTRPANAKNSLGTILALMV